VRDELVYLPRHVDVVLRDRDTRAAVRSLRERLIAEHALLKDGKAVTDTSDAVLWLIEQQLKKPAADPVAARAAAEAKLRG
jgi:hypothetical protein